MLSALARDATYEVPSDPRVLTFAGGHNKETRRGETCGG